MKPVNTNNISFLGYIGLFILFHLPYVGNLIMIICAIFAGKTAVGKFARIIFIIEVIIGIILGVVMALLGDVSFNDFGFPVSDGVEVFRNIAGSIC